MHRDEARDPASTEHVAPTPPPSHSSERSAQGPTILHRWRTVALHPTPLPFGREVGRPPPGPTKTATPSPLGILVWYRCQDGSFPFEARCTSAHPQRRPPHPPPPPRDAQASARPAQPVLLRLDLGSTRLPLPRDALTWLRLPQGNHGWYLLFGKVITADQMGKYQPYYLAALRTTAPRAPCAPTHTAHPRGAPIASSNPTDHSWQTNGFHAGLASRSAPQGVAAGAPSTPRGAADRAAGAPPSAPVCRG
eukprot:gene24689-biopygen5950